ncbi:MAG: SLBB domain-containing protein, partial [Dehalococcoidia bacterium]
YDSKTIDRDGQVYINNIGILNLSGKTIVEASKYITSKYSKVYSTLLGSPPKSFIDVTLGELKSVNVHFVGFVNIPGVHMIHPFSNVISGLSQAGGVDNKGTLRNIQIIRNGEVFRTVDLYNYLFLGKFVNDARLIDQDIIFVPSRSSSIPITGQVKKPGYYEIIENETLSYLLNFTGGLESNSANTLFAYKNGTDKQNAFLLDLSQLENFSLLDGDSIHVPIKPPINNFININGQIKNAGKYPFQKGLSLKRIISATMSNEDEDFMKTIDFQKIAITRRNPSSNEPLNIIVNSEKNNFILMNGDNINIPKINSFANIETVHITGEIKIPGLYPVNNLSSLSDILNMAGGVTNFALKNGVEVFRDSIRIGWENESFFLTSGDSLNVLKKTGLVLVSGEVNVPGYITFKKGNSIKKYIKRAGGYSAFAEDSDVLIIYPNGTAIPKTKLNSPKVFEGSEIIVNQRTISTSSKISGLDAFIAISSSISNITTTLITLSLLINQSQLK